MDSTPISPFHADWVECCKVFYAVALRDGYNVENSRKILVEDARVSEEEVRLIEYANKGLNTDAK
jgi:hypothetical protein